SNDPRGLRWSRGVASLSPINAGHFLSAHDALIAFESAGALAGLERHDWADEAWIKKYWNLGLEPDGYIHLSNGPTNLAALIEVELTSKVGGNIYSSFSKKVPRYIQLMHNHPFAETPIIFTLAVTRRRAESLRQATEVA